MDGVNQHIGGIVAYCAFQSAESPLVRVTLALNRKPTTPRDHLAVELRPRSDASRLTGAFPEGVEVRRLGLAATVQEVATFLKP